MRNAVEAEELAQVLVVRVPQAVAGFAFQVLLYVFRIVFQGRFGFTGDVNELEFGMVTVLLAQLGRGLYACPAGTAGGCPEVDEQHLARMGRDDAAEDVGGFPFGQLVRRRWGVGEPFFQHFAGRGSQIGMGDGFFQLGKEGFGILALL